ncbi:WD40 repeat domain-containing protein, partial [Candidatus Dependentiae bacterium]
NSNAIVSHSGHLVNLDARLVETTDAVYANSWAIQALDDRLDVVEPDVIENSNAIVSHSGHLVNLDERLVATTDSVYANSWAIANLDKRVTENSDAIQANSSLLMSLYESMHFAPTDIGAGVAGLTIDHSNGALYSAVWRPQGGVLAVGGAADLSSEEVAAYTFDSFAQTLTKLPSSGITHGNTVYSIDWHPDGTYLALGGVVGNPDAYEVKVYSFNGSAFTLLTNGKAVHGAWVYSVAWSPDGNYLAVGGDDGTGNYDVRVYDFTPGTQTIAVKTGCNKDHGGIVREIRWHPTGNFLAVGGTSGIGSYTVRVYSFDGTNLTELSGCNKDHGATVYGIDWTDDGNTLAVVGGLGTDSLYGRLYTFNGSTTLTARTGDMPSHGDDLYSCRFNDAGERLLVGGESGTGGYDMRLYGIEAAQITEYSDARTEFGNAVYSAEWHPDEFWVSANGRTPDEAKVYPIIYGSLVEANSDAIVRLDGLQAEDRTLLWATSDAAHANSWGVESLDGRMTVAEARLDTHDIAISDLDTRLVAVTDAVTAHSAAITAHSGHLVNLDERLVATTDAVYANSWAIQALDDRTDLVEPLLYANSNAIVSHSGHLVNLDERLVEATDAINANSWALSSHELRLDVVEPIVWASSNAVVSHSGHLVNLDERLVATTDAVYANSWAIADLDKRVTENSDAIYANSWAIVSSDVVLASENSWSILHITENVAANSNAILHNSWSISTLDHGPADIWLSDGLTTLTYDVVLSSSHRLHALGFGAESDNICDGEGRKISLRFDGTNPLIFVDAGVTVTFKNLIVEGFSDGAIDLADDESSLVFGDGAYVTINDVQTLSRTWTFSGETVLEGYGNELDLGEGGITVNSWSSLLLKSIKLDGVADTNVLCLDQNATISFRDVVWTQTNNYNFMRGAMDVLTELDLTGTASWYFYYSSTETSTVHANAVMKVGRDMTFSYSPDSIGQEMFRMANSTAIIYLDNATLHSTTTGIRLFNGRIVVEGISNLVSDASVLSEAMCFGDDIDEAKDLTFDILPGSKLVLERGIVRDDNIFDSTP